eukprot:c8423_g1_i1.p1 GENE.c8423_g1_i1~~c8423_g1_i1.p1  ORF type:complete len:267 (-),score=52.93 c8423_g1_i1:41-841(-)
MEVTEAVGNVVIIVDFSVCVHFIVFPVLRSEKLTGVILEGSDPFKGDVLCLCGSLCYAISNCVEQRIMTPSLSSQANTHTHTIRNNITERSTFTTHIQVAQHIPQTHCRIFIVLTTLYVYVCFLCFVISEDGETPITRVKFLAAIGSIGTILSSIVVFSMGEMKTTGWTPTTAVCVAAFSICMLGVYSFVPIYLQLGSATSLNLSLLTSDVYAVVADTVLFHKQLDKRYFGGFVVIVLGILTFNYQSFARIRACSTQPHVHKETLP